MRLAGLALAGAALLLAGGTAQAGTPSCAARNIPVGKGLVVTRSCQAASEPNVFDGYYQVVATVVPGDGFRARSEFKKDSAQGKVLKSFLKAFFDTSKASKLVIGLRMSQDGGAEYPVMPLMEFQIVDDKWTSSVVADSRTLLHKLPQDKAFKAKFSFAYSDSASFDLGKAADLVTASGLAVISPAAQPLIAAANSFGDALLATGAINQDSSYEATFSPAVSRRVEEAIQIVDPKNGAVIANVTIQLVGKRSLKGETRPVESLAQTYPTSMVSDVDLNEIGQAAATGQARSQHVLQNALSSTKLADLPLGSEISAGAVRDICAAADTSLANDYQLSSFDSLLVRARLIDAVTKDVQSRINPFKICFAQASERALIKKHLAIETEYEPAPVDNSPPFQRYEMLYAMGCVLTGKAGDECGSVAENRTKLTAAMANGISVGALEGLSNESPIFTDLPADRLFTPTQFLDRFGGHFARFRTITEAAGTMLLHEQADGSALRFEARADPTGKLRSISIMKP